jgi:hypothetical protein
LNYYKASFAMFVDYMNGEPFTGGLQCAKPGPDDCKVTAGMCAAMNDCFGMGECGENGRCICNDKSWKGADCSIQSTSMQSHMTIYKKTTGPKWISYFYDGTSQRLVNVGVSDASIPIDVYVTGTADAASETEHDMELLGVQGNFTLDAADIPYMDTGNGWTINMYVRGFDEADNDWNQ